MELKEARAGYLVQTEPRCPPGYTMTEVGMIPGDWSVRTLGTIGRWYSGGTPSLSVHEYWSGDTPWVSAKDMKVPRIFDSIDHISQKAISDGARTVPSGAILVLVRGMTLAHSVPVAAAGRTISFNQDIKAVVPSGEIDSGFLLFLLTAISHQLLALTAESTHGTKRLPTENLFRHRVPCPTKPEQIAIAEALSDADAYIESLEQLIAKKRQIKQGAMQELLTGKRRLPGFSGEWEIKRLGDICTIGIGRTPSRLNAAYWGSGYPWLSIADLKSKIVSESKEEITPLAAAEMKAVPKNTLLMSFKLSIGRLGFAGCDLYTNEAICSLGGLKADASFLYYLLGRTDFSLYGKQAVKGFTLNSDSLSQIEVFLPKADEQTAIATILSDIDAEITALEDKLAKARRIKQGMMQELLTGRTRLV